MLSVAKLLAICGNWVAMLLAICGSWNVIVDQGSQVDSRWSAFVNVGRQASYICGSWIELKKGGVGRLRAIISVIRKIQIFYIIIEY